MNQSDHWGEYARLQQHADRRKLDVKAWAAEEQADAFLDAIANNTLEPDAEVRELWLINLATNRAKKHRRRAAILHGYVHFRPNSELPKGHDSVVLKETLARVQKSTTNDEWIALLALAVGDSYEALAAAQGCSKSALKTRISRCRKRLYDMCA
jgi:DNA-directed RNA polymerase specialized sigma24 family protein